MLGELDKDCTIRTSGDSASESSVKGDTDDKGITCTRNLVVEEKQPATHLREFRDEIFILKHTLQDHGLLYFCEEGGIENGIHARDEHGWYFTVLESDTFNDESTGLAL